MFNLLYVLMFLTPLITIPLLWNRFKNKVLSVFFALLLAGLLSLLFYVIRGIMFIYH